MITRLMGYSTHVTLHHLTESVGYQTAGIKHPLVDRVFGWLGTKPLLLANSVTVLLPDYRKTLLRKYRGKNVQLRAHGIFASNPEPPDFSQRGNPQRVLAFGKWGTYKRLEMLLEAFESISARMPNVELVIAGEDHPNAPGYLESLRHKYSDRRNIKFTGHVAEPDLSALFRHSSVMVMPYMSADGASGVAHLAAQFGVPVVCADIPDFRDMAEESDLAIEFFEKGNAESLAASLTTVLKDQALQVQMAEQNFSAAVRMTMPSLLSQYVRSFRVHGDERDGQPQTQSSGSKLARFARWTRTRPARAFAHAMTIVQLPTHSQSVARVNVVGIRSSETLRKWRKREELERWRRDRVA
jgi:glycosyltransferase involved in cell wall biosynthesis